MERLLSVDEAVRELKLNRETVRRQLRQGQLRGIKRGRVWRIPESALLESTVAPLSADSFSQGGDLTIIEIATAHSQARELLSALQSTDARARSAAIVKLAKSDATTCAIVQAEVEREVEAHPLDADELSDWRALDGEPFHFPEEVANQ